MERQIGSAFFTDASRLRYAQAEIARGNLFTGKQLVSTTHRQLHERLEHWNDVDSYAFVRRFYFQSAELCGFLLNLDREAFGQFLLAMRGRFRRRRYEEPLQKLFGKSSNDLMDDWQKRVRNSSIPPYTDPPGELKQRIETELIEPMLNQNAELNERRLAIRSLGFLGYVWRADTLIRILESPEETLHADVLYSLENIAGKMIRSEPQHWKDWFAIAQD